jgi:hypothetical protein
MPYKLFDHTADLGVEVAGPSLEGIYNSAAEALFGILSDLAEYSGSLFPMNPDVRFNHSVLMFQSFRLAFQFLPTPL